MSEAEQAGTARQDKSARLLAGRYRLGEVLGRGGMGTVWRAKDETLGRTVAVKELRFPSSIDDEEKRRLITRTLREAKAIARIRNNSAVTVYDVVDEDDRPWIVMELVEGKSLAEQIREDGLLEPRRAAEVGLAILDVLRAAHREGILHRDVKPSNVLIAEDGRVVLTDFGIAQVEGDPSITSTGMLVGAPSYISPERARGHKPGPAADLWSLGGLLYASVEGVPPYDKGSAIATLTAVMTEPVDPPKNAGPLEKVIYGLLAKDPEQRLDDAGARALLNDVLHAPEPKDEAPEPVDATKVVPLPPIPEQTPRAPKASKTPKVRFGKGSSGAAAAAGASAAATSGSAEAGSGSASGVAVGDGAGKRGEEAAEKLRGALRTVRKAAAAATAATAAAAAGKGGGEASGATAEASAHPAVGQGGSGIPAQPAGPPRTPATRASLTDVVPRRTLVIVAVLVALAVIGTVIGIAFSGGDDGSAAKGGDKAASAGATGGSGGSGSKDKDKGSGSGNGAAQDGGKGSDKGKGSGSDTGKGGDKDGDAGQGASPDSTSGGSGVPGGSGAASTYKHDQGFSIGLPKGWKYTSTSAAGARFTGPDGQKLLVGWTTTPKSNPVQDWRNQEQYMRRAQYHRIRIAAVDFRDWNTADWEFTYVDGGTKYRSVDRGFVVNSGLGYGLMYTAKAADWDGAQRKAAWETFTKTFEPKS
ncbi:serine/threonine protein kinase [Streptomyces sp. CB01635]|uniref:serine/threonine-protein kinase n=2 Tax=unclassified Streptomyces TaxID=2593676 RepID=UPI000C26FDD1|nr:serine/threonine-protein kinase [Streptomyces sp. CB01635]PJN10001.1 serine/threonine protein kinase [Streptomyces sp. CB01635]